MKPSEVQRRSKEEENALFENREGKVRGVSHKCLILLGS